MFSLPLPFLCYVLYSIKTHKFIFQGILPHSRKVMELRSVFFLYLCSLKFPSIPEDKETATEEALDYPSSSTVHSGEAKIPSGSHGTGSHLELHTAKLLLLNKWRQQYDSIIHMIQTKEKGPNGYDCIAAVILYTSIQRFNLN